MKGLNGLVLTLAGIGLLSGPGLADGPRLHEGLRSRVLDALGDSATRAASDVRAALRDDPDLDRLLDYLRTRAAASVKRHDAGDDAVQQTLLKVWRGRPDVFLLPHDETIRYLRSATGRNLLTEIDRTNARRGVGTINIDPADNREPAWNTDTQDLVDTLRDRLDEAGQRVLDARLQGHHSERKIAAATGLTRHAIGHATRGITSALSELLDPVS
ncbi:MAG: hypothetical protein VX913_04300 [Planctomycetota bacterium]|nr:hypothetical protein [Planctomycetota bacterium]